MRCAHGGVSGLNALRARFPDLTPGGIGEIPMRDPVMRALARALRIVRAFCRPEHLVLPGGVGIPPRRLLKPLREQVCEGLPSLARPAGP